MTFTGIPVAALDFYDDLEQDNSKAFWQAHRGIYEAQVKQPMLSLTAELAAEFGEAKHFRPFRDVRFSHDKTPYKTHQGAHVPAIPGGGWYLQVDAAGVMIGSGWYDADADRLNAIRHHIDADGARLRQVLDKLAAGGGSIGGDQLKTAPRGWAKDHPHIELLRHRTLSVRRRYDNDPIAHTQEFAERVAADWRSTTPLLDWAAAVPPL